jgi:predicted ATPase
MKKRGVPPRSGRSGVGSATRSEALGDAKTPSESLDALNLDLGGFDLTDFARFLRETDPEWVNGTKKCFSASSIPKR